MYSKWLKIFLCALLATVNAGDTSKWSHSAFLSPDYRLLWSLGTRAGPNQMPQDITFELQVRTLGYVGLGFSRDATETENGVDMVVAWIDKGQVFLQDRHIKNKKNKNNIEYSSEIDISQDYHIILGYQNATHTVIRFKRNLDTCDINDFPITSDTIYVTWSYHDEGLSNGIKHKQNIIHGHKHLYLLAHSNQDLQNDEFFNIWELKNQKVQLPGPGETLYWCIAFRLPQINKKHHLIRYEPLLENINKIQHIILYECETDDAIRELIDKGGEECYDPDSQPFSCNTIVASWSKGSEGFTFPPEAGYPLEPSVSRYFLMETHYYTNYNSGNEESYDNSGLKLYYTPKLRPNDAGLLSIGIDPNWRHIIPPGQQKVVSSGHCISDCTLQAFPKSGINIFGVVMKTRRIGKQVTLRRIRNDLELPPIASDKNINSDYQEIRKLDEAVKVLPGDNLIVECIYNSSSRPSITLGGLTRREEMCLAVALYYPRQTKITACHSLPSLHTVLQSLGIQELDPDSSPVKISVPSNLAGMSLEERLITYDWENQFDSFQLATQQGSFQPICRTSHSRSLLSNILTEAYYPNATYYRPRKNSCSPQLGQRTRIKETDSRLWTDKTLNENMNFKYKKVKNKPLRSNILHHGEQLMFTAGANLIVVQSNFYLFPVFILLLQIFL